MTNKNVITKKDLNKISRRWMPMSVTVFNYQTQMAGNLVHASYPALRKIYQDDNELEKALENHFKFFNCQPWLAPVIFGATLAIEDNDGLESREIVQDLKTSLMGPLSGVGDTIFWVLYPTVIGSIAAYMALEGNPVGTIIWILLNIALMPLRFYAPHIGYKQGTKLISKLGNKVGQLTDSISILGIIVVGALIPTVIKITTPVVISYGEVKTEIQPLLDQILPSLIPVVLVYSIFKLIKTGKVGITSIILIVIILSMVAAYFGILV